MAQELEGGHRKNTLLPIYHEAEITQPLEHRRQVLFMRLQVRAGYTEVIQVAVSETEARQGPVHHPLETAASIA
jgi:hypothetical protein